MKEEKIDMKHLPYRLAAVLLVLCMALSILPASAEKVNLTEQGVFKAPPGEIRMYEVGDITVDQYGAIFAKSENSHVIVNAGNLSGKDCDVCADAWGGSVVINYGDLATVDGVIGQIRTNGSAFVRVTGALRFTRTGTRCASDSPGAVARRTV